jgi:hypothetical protein
VVNTAHFSKLCEVGYRQIKIDNVAAAGLRSATAWRGSWAVVVRFMPVKVDKQGRPDNLMNEAGQNFSEFRFFIFRNGLQTSK